MIRTSLCKNLACLGTRRATCKELRELMEPGQLTEDMSLV